MPVDNVRTMDYWYTVVADRPGAADQILKKLRTANVNLTAFLAFPVPGGRSQVDLIPVDPETFEAKAEAAGVSVSTRKHVLFVEGRDRAGVLADLLEKVATAGVNCTAGAAIATADGGYGFLLWVPPGDLPEAAKALS